MKTPSTHRPPFTAYDDDDLAPFAVRSYDKQELASLYAPGKTTAHSQRKFNAYIKRNKTLLAELDKTGFTFTARRLTSKQVRMIIDLLGEP